MNTDQIINANSEPTMNEMFVEGHREVKCILVSQPKPNLSYQSTSFIAIVYGFETLNFTILELKSVKGIASFPTVTPFI